MDTGTEKRLNGAMRWDERSLSHLQLAGTVVVVVLLILSLGYIHINQMTRELEAESHQIRQQQETRLRQELVQQMETARGFLQSMQNRTEMVLKQQIRDQVDQAHAMAEAIYRREQGRRPDAQVKSLIIEALRPMRFFGGKGYYFVDGMDGQCLLLPINPDREGTSLIDNRDDAGHYIMRGLIEAAEKPVGEGYSRYRWFAPGSKTMLEKIAYVRHFAPYDWLIGTGQYVRDVEAVLKDEALQRLRTFRFGSDGTGYMVVMTNDRQILVSPARPWHEGQKVEALPADDRGVPNRILDQAFEGDGFVSYDWQLTPDSPPSRKLTYVSRLPEWGWVLATGVSLDGIEAEASLRQRALEQMVQRKIRLTILVLAVGLIVSVILGMVISRLTSRLVGRYQADLERQNQDIRHKAEELEHSNADLEQFAYIASHDLREPLRMVTSYMSLLERRYGQRLDRDGLEFLAFAREGAARMDRLVLDLLEFSRIERRGAPMADMVLGPVLEAAMANLNASIRESGAQIVAGEEVRTATLHADEVQILRLLQNLIGNAIKYRDPQRVPEIRLSACLQGNLWEICVADNGIGIESQYFERIFGIFQRLHTRVQYEGTGIGLAVCRKIAERHGGKIWLTSQPGQGSQFYVTLPAAAKTESL